MAYERRIEIVTREWTDTPEPGARHAVVIAYFGILLSWLLSRAFVPLGVFGLLVTLLVAVGLGRKDLRPERKFRTRPANVKLTERGITIEEEGTIPADLIASAYVQPNRAGKPLVVVRGQNGNAVFQALAEDEADAARMLEAIGHGPQQHRTLFVASSPVGSFLPLGLATLLAVALVSLPLHATPLVRMMLGSAGFIATLAFALGPRHVEVGTEGVLVTWRGREQYIRFEEITSLGRRGETVRIQSGARQIKIAFSPLDERMAEALEHRIRSAKDGASGAPSPVTARLTRGEQSPAEWHASLRRLGEVSYRDAGISEDELWQIVHDPTASEEARAAAAVLLRNRPEAHPRLRIAAESAASPRLRVALEAAADPEAEEEEILDRFAAEA